MNATRCFTLNWRVLSRWDLKGARAASFRIQHPDFRPMGDFVEESTELVRPADKPEKDWPVYGVNNRHGVFFSHYQKGSEFNSNYKRIRADWFFHNPTRANVGSLGRVPPVPDDAITSPEYQVWRIREGLLPDFVEILLHTRFFLDLVDIHRVGAVKQRLFVQNLMEIPIPVRSIQFQTEIVRCMREVVAEIEERKTNITRHASEMLDSLFERVGIRVIVGERRAKAFAMPFSKLERWGVGFNRHPWRLDNLLRSEKYPSYMLSELAEINPITSVKLSDDDLVTFVPMDAVCEVMGEIADPTVRLFSEVKTGFTRFVDGDVIWAKITPCMQNGNAAVARKLQNGIGFGSTEFHVIRTRDDSRLKPEFIWIVLRLKEFRQAAQRYFTGSAGQQRVPADFLENLHLPLPPPEVQQSVVDQAHRSQEEITQERNQIDSRMTDALNSIQTAILTGRFDSEWTVGTIQDPSERIQEEFSPFEQI